MNETINTPWLNRLFPFLPLFLREIHRVRIIAFQTIAAPIVSLWIYLAIFGITLGARLPEQNGIDYFIYLVPGLVAMAVLINSYQNAVGSIVNAKINGDVEDLRVAPISDSSIVLGFVMGSVTRGWIIALIALLTGFVFLFFNNGYSLKVEYPILLIGFVTASGWIAAYIGLIVGFLSKTLEHTTVFFIVLMNPLIYLGGVFFSIEMLHDFWQLVSQFNPLFYMINGVRFAILGVSDANILTSVMGTITGALVLHVVTLIVLQRAESLKRW